MNLGKEDLDSLCKIATVAAKSAGEYIQSQLDKHHSNHYKEEQVSLASQVVTAVDIKAQEIILSHLDKSIIAYDLGLLTEESADNHSRFQKSYFWCVDPLDGTLPFTEGIEGYAVSIALVSNAGNPVIGIVYIPDLLACYTTIKGEGVLLNDEPLMRQRSTKPGKIHCYMDRSFQSDVHFEEATSQLKKWAKVHGFVGVEFHVGFGAVRNAIGAMTSEVGCYFKLSKKQKGGGSIWDYAATRLFFEELGLPISDAKGDSLHLNNRQTVYMNKIGVLYATDRALSEFVMEINNILVGGAG